MVALELFDDDNYSVYSRRLTKTQRKKIRNQETQQKNKLIELKSIFPKTENQALAFNYYNTGSNLFLHGVAGTGKTFVSVYLALNEVLYEDSPYHSVTIVRSVVPTRDIGFLPGKESEKSQVYEEPYDVICRQISGRSDTYSLLKQRNVIKFTTTSFKRGITFDNSIVIVDEAQNLTFHELDTIITRMGENSKIIFCGDFRQTDLNKPHEQSGIGHFMKIIKTINNFNYVEFDYNDIVRSELVKQYIIAKDKINDFFSHSKALS